MTGRVAEIENLISKDFLAVEIANKWEMLDGNRNKWKTEKRELRDYVFATDTTKTTNSQLPWKNKTTLPKLCQIRDNLHANYMAALFPNDSWLRWEAYSEEGLDQEKKEVIESYMANKTRRGDFRKVISNLLYDYIDYGNCFADAVYVNETAMDENGLEYSTYSGPRAVRISPFDIVFNPTAISFDGSYKITRSLKTIGELKLEAKQNPAEFRMKAIEEVENFRNAVAHYDTSEVNKAHGIVIDGFGSYSEYLESGYVEVLEFEGDIHDKDGNFLTNQVITIMDRTTVLRKEDNKSWAGKSTIVHSDWRKRPDNLYGMGPLDNLVGMQYRIDHLENIKADLFDLIAHPPLKIKGNVEEFDWEPFAQIIVGDDGDIDTLKVEATALQADTQIAILEAKMDEFAGAPKQAIGARTPGEKTAFEVQTLENNANKMFQEKIQQFEIEVIEPLLNSMLELARQELDGVDLVGVIDRDFGVENFMSITKEDLRAKGKIRPVGARHFAARAQMVQNYMGFRNIFAMDPSVMNHISGKKEAEMFEDLLGLSKFDLVRDNVRIEEQAESQKLLNSFMQSVEEQALTPVDEELPF
jgi:hypothetical protein